MTILDNELQYLCSHVTGRPDEGISIFGEKGDSYKLIEHNYFSNKENECGLDVIIVEREPDGDKAMIFLESDELKKQYEKIDFENTKEVPRPFKEALEYYESKVDEYDMIMPVVGEDSAGLLAYYIADEHPGIRYVVSISGEEQNTIESSKVPITDEVVHDQFLVVDKNKAVDSVHDANTSAYSSASNINASGYKSQVEGIGSSLNNHQNHSKYNVVDTNKTYSDNAIIINNESLQAFGKEMQREFSLMDEICYSLTEKNIAMSDKVAAEAEQRKDQVKQITANIINNNFLTMSRDLSNQFGLKLVRESSTYSGGGGGMYGAKPVEITTIGLDLFDTIADVVNVSGIGSTKIYCICYDNNHHIATAMSNIDDLVRKLYAELDNIISNIIKEVVVDAQGHDVAPNTISGLSRLLHKRIIFMAQNLLRLGFVSSCIGKTFDEADAACNDFNSEGTNKDSWAEFQNVYNSSAMSKTQYTEFLIDGTANIKELSGVEGYNEDNQNQLNELRSQIKNFKNDVVEARFNQAFEQYKNQLRTDLNNLLHPICDGIDQLINALDGHRDGNGEVYLEVWDSTAWSSLPERVETASNELSLSKAATLKGFDINDLFANVRTKLEDLRQKLSDVDSVAAQVAEDIKNMIFYTKELEEINVNNVSCYNALVQLESELSKTFEVLNENKSEALNKLINDSSIVLSDLKTLIEDYKIVVTLY